MREIRRVLVVEDDSAMRRTLVRVGRSLGAEVTSAATLEDGMRLVTEGADLVLLDVRLPDGSGVALAEAAFQLRPAPIIVAISGEANPAEAFRLAQAGVIEFVQKPFSLDVIERAIEKARTHVPRLEPFVAAFVGQTDMKRVQDGVRWTMVEQAMARANGNRSDAARMLRVSRQAIQNLLRRAPRKRP